MGHGFRWSRPKPVQDLHQQARLPKEDAGRHDRQVNVGVWFDGGHELSREHVCDVVPPGVHQPQGVALHVNLDKTQ